MATNDNDNQPHEIIGEDAPAISVQDSSDTGEGGKLKMIVQLVKKCLGVKDIATMRLSLPASLLEPVPNLEYWQYLDRPDIFAAINDSDDPFQRILAVVRFTFTKDLKFVHGKVCKPYNSVLGEHFRAHWDVPPVMYHPEDPSHPPIPLIHTTISPESAISSTSKKNSEQSSLESERSSKSTRSGWFSRANSSTAATSLQSSPQATGSNIAAQMSSLNLSNSQSGTEKLRVIYITEQVSHHPPVSAYYAACPKRHLQMSGIDQISAKVAGTTIKVSPGQYNRGIYVKITGGHVEGENYNITHPIASVNGILRGTFYATVSESTMITCTGGKGATKFRAILEYKEESWLGKAHFLVEGVIHTVFEGETGYEEWTKVKHVPQNRVVAVFDGTWRGRIRWKRVGTGSYRISSTASSPSPSHEHLPKPSIPPHAASKASLVHPDDDMEYKTLIDLSTINVVPKSVRPVEKQEGNESRKLWEKVTNHLENKEYNEATKEKVGIEQKQRDDAADRKKKGIEFVPRYFEKDLSKGFANLTKDGWEAVKAELEEDSSFCVEGSENAKLSS